MFSTKGRYALRVMIDLAQQDPEAYIPLKDIAERPAAVVAAAADRAEKPAAPVVLRLASC